ncbi:uncharacterized protein LOC122067159 [Macadamia integrifolia]|uniref:uncharacterized protein LOC122067159 n=1 Tax=Macadamia integrifolia TaxID=60698 RepID=UPI001C4E47B1|nr:uncharacterized protein LOC122067159 [Macadamia integrifolia]XP_042486936.1 uncharacterized protein LOC122067159 [Macadamia integrifolia]
MSNEESKILAELDDDVERDLEEEIKNGICHLALRLHRLYQHQSDKNERELSKSGTRTRSVFNNKAISEVKITIRMEAGGSQIEINEIKKVARQSQTSISEGKEGKVFPSAKKFNWVDTLRSGNSPAAIINKKHEMSHGTARVVRKVHDLKPYVKEGRSWKDVSTDRKKNACT